MHKNTKNCIVFSGAMDHKTHGSGHTTDFELRIWEFFQISKKKIVLAILITNSIL